MTKRSIGMHATAVSSPASHPVIRRLATLAHLSAEDVARLEKLVAARRTSTARRDIVAAGAQSAQTLLMLDGWALRSCLTVDGRRQITQFLIPGDIVTFVATDASHANGLTALTAVGYCPAPDIHPRADSEGFAGIAIASNALELKYLYRQVARLGRMDAFQRTVDWLLEMRERLYLAGLAHGERFPLPLTQEVMADALGLTSVHVNRTLQALRRDGLVQIGEGWATLRDRKQCEFIVGRHR